MRITRNIPTVSLTLALTWLVALPVSADDALPTGEQIMENYVKSTGGKDAYQRIKNRVIKGEMSMMGSKMGDFERTGAVPNKMFMQMKSPMSGDMMQGYDGETVWMSHPMMGSQILTGEQADQLKREAYFNREVEWRKIYKTVKCLELTELDGIPCYAVELTPNTGKPMTAYFEKDTWLQRGMKMKVQSQMGESEITVLFKNYKEVDGLLIPHELRQSFAGMENIMTITSVEHNVELPKDRFDVPQAVLDAAKKMEEQEKAATKPEGEKSGEK